MTYFIIKDLHDKGGHAAIDPDEEVDAGQHHVRRAGHREDERRRVHHWGDGPPKEHGHSNSTIFDSKKWKTLIKRGEGGGIHFGPHSLK